MNNVNKTLYIPLYGKSYVSKKGIILNDKKAESIWEKVQFPLRGKSRSKWLAYYMGMRSRVFDDWTIGRIREKQDAVVIHIGCGLDSRVERVGGSSMWYDVDFLEVIEERRRYYSENDSYQMVGTDVRQQGWLKFIPNNKPAIVIMEGVSMYLDHDDLISIISMLCNHFTCVSILMDCYTVFAAKASKIKNPINDVGVTEVFGIDDPLLIERAGIKFIKEHDMTPEDLISELSGLEKSIFRGVYGGIMSKKLYRLYEYEK